MKNQLESIALCLGLGMFTLSTFATTNYGSNTLNGGCTEKPLPVKIQKQVNSMGDENNPEYSETGLLKIRPGI